ncbi:MAG TPA: substrate-binding domain-containing protein [Pseudobacteroides sp.]|uniref:substrate-binding domain-containing protein n=1 Tax=Pseudobacteroides sp. TaxID=1968840 RepID=UPI002F92FC84
MDKRLRIGVITKFTEGTYHGNLINGIYNCVKDMNAKLFVINTFMISRFSNEIKKVESYYNLAFEHVDGWIVLPEGASQSHINAITEKGKPMVFIGVNDGGKKSTLIKGDNIKGAKNAVEHLIMHGHRKVGFIGWMGSDDMKERFLGYKDTLLHNGIPFDENLVYFSQYAMPRDGKLAIEHWIKNKIEFTAIFTGNDSLAVGALKELNSHGISVPEDVAVIGYDNSYFAKNCNPGITTIDQNVYDLGFTSAKTLIDKIKNRDKSGKTVFIKSELVIRKSCGCKYAIDDSKDISIESAKKKDSIIKYLEEAILKNSDIGTKLLTTDINGIKKLFPFIVDDYSWECIGFWDDEKSERESIDIKALYDVSKNLENLDLSCSLDNFPPFDILENKKCMDNDDIIWIMPISSTTRNWGVMAYASPFKELSALTKYNISVVINTLLGIAMDRDVAKTELEATLETLKQTQKQLIHSEKIAALGGLVAGVAHEINTPVGVNVTAASYLKDKNNEIIKSIETGKIKKVDLKKYIETAMETIEILTINLDRASNLLKSFTQIASDQSIVEKRRFFIKDYINEVLLSLYPKIKSTSHKIIVNCDDNLVIYASPGGMSQVITNLVINSLFHGFENMKAGTIEISVTKEFNEIVIEYSDNGKGISENDIKKIYEPFFTTKRGKGGTGLGLNLVYNIITNEYSGNIKCKSTLGKGTTFIIKIPD